MRDVKQMIVAAEMGIGALQLATALDADLARTIDRDVVDVGIAHQIFERPHGDNVVRQLMGDRLLLGSVEQSTERRLATSWTIRSRCASSSGSVI